MSTVFASVWLRRVLSWVVAAALVGCLGAVVTGQWWGWSMALSAVLGFLVVAMTQVRSALVPRWGPVSSWMVVSLVAAGASAIVVWLFPQCYADVGQCARASLSWALVGVLFAVVAVFASAAASAVRSTVRMVFARARRPGRGSDA